MSTEQTTPQNLTLERAAQSFYLDREAARCTPATLTWYRKYLGELVAWLASRGVTTLAAVTPDELRAYLVTVQGRDLAPRTVHHHASAARAFFRFMEAEGRLPAGNPMAKIRMPKLPKEILPAFTPEDARKLLDACEHERDTAIVLFLLDSGLRAAEFCKLNIGDVDLATGAVMVRAGKGRKDRTAYLGSRARRALLKYLEARETTQPGDPLWLTLTRGETRLTQWGLRQVLERLSARSGVRRVNPHTFRRTFALWSLRAGMDLVRLAAIMGHSDLGILRRYLALVEHDLQDAHRRFGAVDTMLRR